MIRAASRAGCWTAKVAGRCGFTLVELMVVTAVLAILASLMLAGLAVVRNRAKEDKTRSTIRKIHEIIVPHYETYPRRRVSFTPDPTNRIQNARNKLVAQRLLLVREMPDNWSDASLSTNPTSPMLAYARYRSSLPGLTTGNGTDRGECLAMIVLKGGVPPQEAESFRTDEIGDTDNDGAVEFVDAWGGMISFIRWYPWDFVYFQAYASVYTGGVDPMDPLRVSGAGVPPNNTPDPFFVPLIVSGGGPSRTINIGNLGSFGLSGTSSGSQSYFPSTWIEMLSGSAPSWVQATTGTGPIYAALQRYIYIRNVASGSLSTGNFVYGQVGSDTDITNRDITYR